MAASSQLSAVSMESGLIVYFMEKKRLILSEIKGESRIAHCATGFPSPIRIKDKRRGNYNIR